MQVDRTTKLLLLAIAGGLWFNALRPVFSPTPAVAQGRVTDVNIVKIGGRDASRFLNITEKQDKCELRTLVVK